MYSILELMRPSAWLGCRTGSTRRLAHLQNFPVSSFRVSLQSLQQFSCIISNFMGEIIRSKYLRNSRKERKGMEIQKLFLPWDQSGVLDGGSIQVSEDLLTDFWDFENWHGKFQTNVQMLTLLDLTWLGVVTLTEKRENFQRKLRAETVWV